MPMHLKILNFVCHAQCHAVTFHEDPGPWVGRWVNFLSLISPQETKIEQGVTVDSDVTMGYPPPLGHGRTVHTSTSKCPEHSHSDQNDHRMSLCYFCFPVALTNRSIGTQKLTKFYLSTSS